VRLAHVDQLDLAARVQLADLLKAAK